jgi:hypothetical protein
MFIVKIIFWLGGKDIRLPNFLNGWSLINLTLLRRNNEAIFYMIAV